MLSSRKSANARDLIERDVVFFLEILNFDFAVLFTNLSNQIVEDSHDEIRRNKSTAGRACYRNIRRVLDAALHIKDVCKFLLAARQYFSLDPSQAVPGKLLSGSAMSASNPR